MSALATAEFLDDWSCDSDNATPFGAESVSELAAGQGLRVPGQVVGAVTAAIRAGKHVILTGPPGTGKSTLAKLVAEAGRRALMCTGYLTATATADWSTADTIGTSVDSAHGRVFRAGVATQAIDSGRWLIIDEFNRADIDRAFGELFSVLAGQEVVLAHRRSEMAPPLSIVPFGGEVPEATEPICIPKPWRIIATMNSTDRGLLFALSRALMRRFAFVNVSSPDGTVFRQLLDGPGEIVSSLLLLRELQDIGPAIFLDAADYAAIRRMDGVTRSLILFEAFTAYVWPQLDELDDDSMSFMYGVLDRILDEPERQAVRELIR